MHQRVNIKIANNLALLIAITDFEREKHKIKKKNKRTKMPIKKWKVDMNNN